MKTLQGILLNTEKKKSTLQEKQTSGQVMSQPIGLMRFVFFTSFHVKGTAAGAFTKLHHIDHWKASWPQAG